MESAAGHDPLRGPVAALPRHWYEGFTNTWRSMASVLGLRSLQDLIQGTYALSDQPAWLLGTWYGIRDHDAQEDTLPPEMEAALLADFGCRLWLTYRRGFPPIGQYGPTSDTGWGCTLRTGQMMLAEALLRDRLGRQVQRPAAAAGVQAMCEVLQLFLDYPSPSHPFSIHNICWHGSPYGVVPGQWLGPWVLCKALEASVAGAAGSPVGLAVHVVCDPGGGAPQLQVLRVKELLSKSVASEGAAAAEEEEGTEAAAGLSGLRIDDPHPGQQQNRQGQQVQLEAAAVGAEAAAAGTSRAGLSGGQQQQQQAGLTYGSGSCCASTGTGASSAAANGCASAAAAGGAGSNDCGQGPRPSGLLLLVPLTLGVGKVNERYLPQLQQVLTLPQSVGIVGGRPSASLYFVGYQGEHIMYLDPHDTQDLAVLPEDLETYFCCTPRLMPLSAIDPSLAIGFYCQTQEDVQDLCQRLQAITAAAGGAPLLTLDWGTGVGTVADPAAAAAAGGSHGGAAPATMQKHEAWAGGGGSEGLERVPSSGDEWQLV